MGSEMCIRDSYYQGARISTFHVAHSQLWVVGRNGTGTDQNAVDPAAPAVSVFAGSGTGDPARVGSAGGDLSVQSLSEFQDDQGAAGLPVFEVGGILALGLVAEQADFHFEAGFPELLQARTAHPRIRILQGTDHAFDAGVDEGSAAGWGATLVRTRLKGYVKIAEDKLGVSLTTGTLTKAQKFCVGGRVSKLFRPISKSRQQSVCSAINQHGTYWDFAPFSSRCRLLPGLIEEKRYFVHHGPRVKST